MVGNRILITGVAGFIGFNLAKRLLIDGYEVIGIDDFSSGYRRNIEHLNSFTNFTFTHYDILHLDFKSAILLEKVSVVFHLAAGKIPRYSNALPTLRVNAIGSDNVFKICAKLGCKIIAASTSDVYGKNPAIPFHENSDLVVGSPDVKRWSYAVSKMYEEQLLYAYSDEFKIPTVAVRFFGAYGPGQNLSWKGGPIPVFIEKCLKRDVLEIHGDGKQIRSFTFIDDHVEALKRLVTHQWQGAFHINLGSDHGITILELAEKISILIRPNSELAFKFVPYSSFGKYEDVARRIPDCSMARKLLDLPPATQFEVGLQRTIEWQKSVLGIVD